MNKKVSILTTLFLTSMLMFSAPSASKDKHYILGTKTFFVEGEYEIISDLKVSNLQIRQVRKKTNWTKINCDPKKEVSDHIEVNGPINPDTPFIVERLLDRIANNNPCTDSNGTPYSVRVYLNSGGGYIRDGYKLGEILRKDYAHTVIPTTGECYSSCAAAFLGGGHRSFQPSETLGSEGKLMFHAPYRYKSKYYGIGRADIACNAKDDELRNYMVKMLNSKDGNFLYERTMSYCSISDGWSLNKDAAELFNILK